MADNLFLEIVSPQGIIFEGNIDQVTLPGVDGIITVLPHHVPLFTKLIEGEIEVVQLGKRTSYVISGGFFEINNNKASVLSDYAIRAESIAEAAALEKKRQAEQKLREKLTNEEFTIADKDLRISILELKVAQKVRRRQKP
ncbi:MAG: ATP synthase F1 subunit epsilon [Candidatus Levybacteria bacterium RIFCSPHIGHO2_02_FULL_40_18]|nr:MAG: ATP synthase F1 subunit epsilon [Candidatus Levybacteria bacterium RIFCSPHIGHO2_01_FULL_40_58]OGH27110.1 MAG: ATP synthase F1 subunit epsilon [Candidatus Levybacteria bacterium RIFCSPHIGHO2_02_FULL_40_18]OGH30969.1 MAG: ATP synthase F1 subunit epsilon [Candidatus Levybacteria bacterium RIFCSPHIGHO2_12_FULL_40_31]OGH40980.1 MAG: ATP synthase F1 subunit epsilon [Candidatus Levybacteria bacterium RIFCSPLOWO2_01_FULL_40_64]OGH48943.1 MAG: ATP synthase F1 subunit epsilon [Candidatus Levybact